MGFVADGTSVLPPVKVNANAPSGNPSEWAAGDANKIRSALEDLRNTVTAMSTGVTVGGGAQLSASNGVMSGTNLPFSNGNGVSFLVGSEGAMYASVSQGTLTWPIYTYSQGVNLASTGPAVFWRTEYPLSSMTGTATLTTDQSQWIGFDVDAAWRQHEHGSISISGGLGATSASSGLSLSVGPYITTAAASNHTHGSMYLTNLTGTYSTNGLSLSAAQAFQQMLLNDGTTDFVGLGGTALTLENQSGLSWTYVASNGHIQAQPFLFFAGSGISFSTNGRSITIRTVTT